MQFAFFLLFVVSVLIFGSIKVGPLSIRVYMTVLMLAYLIIAKRPAGDKPYKIRTDYIAIFIVCILTLGIALTINGGLEAYGFLERCLAYYLVCVVGYFAVDLCVKNAKHIDIFVLINFPSDISIIRLCSSKSPSFSLKKPTIGLPGNVCAILRAASLVITLPLRLGSSPTQHTLI